MKKAQYIKSQQEYSPPGGFTPRSVLFRLETLVIVFMIVMAGVGIAPLFATDKAEIVTQQEEEPTGIYPGYLNVIFFDVNQGDATLIVSPTGTTMLIDGGSGSGKYTRFDGSKHVIIPFLKENNIKKIDYMIMTHPHADHVGGLLGVLEAVPVSKVLEPGMTYGSNLYKRFLSTVEKKGTDWIEARDEFVLDLGGDVMAQILSPPDLFFGTRSDANNNSVVIKIMHKSTSFLVTGDIEESAEYELLSYGLNLRSNVLKVPHHGGEFSSTNDFVRLVKPDIAVISCGYNNKFGHPHKDTVERYEKHGAKIYRTDYCGTITMVSDGKKIRVTTKKECNK